MKVKAKQSDHWQGIVAGGIYEGVTRTVRGKEKTLIRTDGYLVPFSDKYFVEVCEDVWFRIFCEQCGLVQEIKDDVFKFDFDIKQTKKTLTITCRSCGQGKTFKEEIR